MVYEVIDGARATELALAQIARAGMSRTWATVRSVKRDQKGNWLVEVYWFGTSIFRAVINAKTGTIDEWEQIEPKNRS